MIDWIVSGNRDETAFDTPFRVDLARTPNKQISFGQVGPHLCLGMWLARLEHRMADASCNPCAALLQAALLSVENGYALPEPEAGDGFDRTDARYGVAGSLAEAIVDLAADTVLGDALGRELFDHHVLMKRIEVTKTAGLEGGALRDYYIWYV